MVRSVRLDPALERRLAAAAKLTGQPVSAVIREAVAHHCDAVLRRDAQAELADVIGVVDVKSDAARDTGAAFKKLLATDRPR